MMIVGLSLQLAIMAMMVKAQMDEPPVPPGADLKCVSGFCLPRGYKKLETPITEGKHRFDVACHF